MGDDIASRRKGQERSRKFLYTVGILEAHMGLMRERRTLKIFRQFSKASKDLLSREEGKRKRLAGKCRKLPWKKRKKPGRRPIVLTREHTFKKSTRR